MKFLTIADYFLRRNLVNGTRQVVECWRNAPVRSGGGLHCAQRLVFVRERSSSAGGGKVHVVVIVAIGLGPQVCRIVLLLEIFLLSLVVIMLLLLLVMMATSSIVLIIRHFRFRLF